MRLLNGCLFFLCTLTTLVRAYDDGEDFLLPLRFPDEDPLDGNKRPPRQNDVTGEDEEGVDVTDYNNNKDYNYPLYNFEPSFISVVRLNQRTISSISDVVCVNNEPNLLLVQYKENPEDVVGLLYKWEVPNGAADNLTLYTASPIFQITPKCPADNQQCDVVFTRITIDPENMFSLLFPVVDPPPEPDIPAIEHPNFCVVDEEITITFNCLFSHCIAQVADEPPVPFQGVLALKHHFPEYGIHMLILSDGIYNVTSYICIQTKLTDLEIYGVDRVLADKQFNIWMASVNNESFAVYKWIISLLGMEDQPIKTMISTKKFFDYGFAKKGNYTVSVEVFNDVSRASVKKQVIAEDPVHLKVMPTPLPTSEIFTIGTTELPGKNDVIEAAHLRLYRNNRSTPMTSPYHVALDDVVTVELRDDVTYVVDVIVSNDQYQYEERFYLSPYSYEDEMGGQRLQDIAILHPGQYSISTTTSNLASSNRFNIFVTRKIRNIQLRAPYSDKQQKFVSNCRLLSYTPPSLNSWSWENDILHNNQSLHAINQECELLQLSALTDGDLVQCRFNVTLLNEAANDVTTGSGVSDVIGAISVPIEAETTSAPVMTHRCTTEYYFKKEGNYLITVRAWNQLDDEIISFVTSSPGKPFIAQSLPDVVLRNREYYVIKGRSVHFQLTNYKEEQSLLVNWLIDGEVFRDGGLSFERSFNETGKRLLHVEVYNNVGHLNLSVPIFIHEKLEEVKVMTSSRLMSTFQTVHFSAETFPPGAGKQYKWQITGAQSNTTITYRSIFNHMFFLPGRYRVRVVAINQVSKMTSDYVYIELHEKITVLNIIGPKVVKVNEVAEYELQSITGSNLNLMDWKISDGSRYTNTSKIQHTFTEQIVYEIEAMVANPLSKATVKLQVFVVGEVCSIPKIETSTDIHKTVFRAEMVRMEAKLQSYKCDRAADVRYSWKIHQLQSHHLLCKDVVFGVNSSLEGDVETMENGRVLVIPPLYFRPGNYCLDVVATLDESPIETSLDHKRRLQVMTSQFHVKFELDSPAPMSRDSYVIVNASQSHDPDQMVPLRFLWECHVIESPLTSCFNPESFNDDVIADQIDLVMDLFEKIHRRFPRDVASDQEILNFPATFLQENFKLFLFKLTVYNENDESKTNEGQFQVDVTDDDSIPVVHIDCPLCDSSTSRHGLVMSSTVEGLSFDHNRPVDITWSVSKVRKLDEDMTSSSMTSQKKTYNCSPRSSENILRLQGNKTDVSKLEEKLYYLGAYRYLNNYTEALKQNNRSSETENSNLDDEEVTNEISSNYQNLLPETGQYEELYQLYTTVSPIEMPGEYDYESTNNGNGSFINLKPEESHGGPIRFELQNSEMMPGTRSGTVSESNLYPPEGNWFDPAIDLLINDEIYQVEEEVAEEETLDHVPHLVDDLASGSKDMIVLHPDQLDDGQLYAVKVTYHEAGNVIASSTKFVKTRDGPLDGRCAVINLFLTDDMFRVYCRDWKVRRHTTFEENHVELDEDKILFYEMSYTLPGSDHERPIYYGTLFAYDFYLPVQLQTAEVFVNVRVLTEDDDVTEVCSYPVNVTGSALPEGENVIDTIHADTISSSGNLIHSLHEHDDNAIILFFHITLDSLPKMAALNTSVETQKFEEILVKLASSLLQIKGDNLRKINKIITCCVRVFEFEPKLKCQIRKDLIRVITNQLKDSTRVIEKCQTKSSTTENIRMTKKIAMEIHHHVMSTEVLRQVFYLYEDFITSKCGKENEEEETVELLNEMKRMLLAANRWKMKFEPVAMTSKHVSLISQSASLNLFFNKSSLQQVNQVGVEFPENQKFPKKPEDLQQTLMSYNRINPFFVIESPNQKVENNFLSVWLTDSQTGNDVRMHNYEKNIRIRLLPRVQNTVYKTNTFVKNNEVAYHELLLNSDGMDQTLHVQVEAEEHSTRAFSVNVALTHRKLSPDDIINFRQNNDELDTGSSSVFLSYGIIGKRSSRSKTSDLKRSVKLTLPARVLLPEMTYYLVMWKARDQEQGSAVTSSIETVVEVMANVWSSDCFYWVPENKIWSKNGLEASADSTFEQTVCLTNHLSTFASSFRPVQFTTNRQKLFRKQVYGDYLLLLCTITFLHLVALVTSQRLVESASDVSSVTRHANDIYDSRGGIHSLRRWIGANKIMEPVVPVILGDNKFYHTQIFEITVQTGCWPGSAGSDDMSVYVTLHSTSGSYKKRKLCKSDGGAGCGEERDKECLFRNASAKVFLVTHDQCLGDPVHITLTCVDNGLRPDTKWYVDYIIVRDLTTQKRFYFPCHQWIIPRHVEKIKLGRVEEQPGFLRSVLIRMRNGLLEKHSLVSIITCPHWGCLQRSQRIVHLMALSLIILALSCSQHFFGIRFVSINDFSGTMFERGLWSVIVALFAWILAQPGHLIHRCTELDERISIVVEDDTSTKNTSNLPDESGSRALGGGEGMGMTHRLNKDPSRAGLRKTETLAQFDHNFDFDLGVGSDYDRTHDPDDVITSYTSSSEGERAEYAEYEIRLNGGDNMLRHHDDVMYGMDNMAYEQEDDDDVRYNSGYPQINVINPITCHPAISGEEISMVSSDDVTIPSASGMFSSSSDNNSNSGGAMSFVQSSSNIPESCSDIAWASVDQSGIVLHEKPLGSSASKNGIVELKRGRFLPRYFNLVATCYYILLIISALVLTIYVTCFNPRRLGDELASSSIWWRTALFAFLLVTVVIEVVKSALVSFMFEVVARCRYAALASSDAVKWKLRTLGEMFPSVEKVEVDEFFYKTNERAFDIKDDLLDTTSSSKGIFPYSRSERKKMLKRKRGVGGGGRRSKVSRRKSALALRVLSRWIEIFLLLILLLIALKESHTDSWMKSRMNRDLRRIMSSSFTVRDSIVFQAKGGEDPYDVINSTAKWNRWFRDSFDPAVNESHHDAPQQLGTHHVIIASVTSQSLSRRRDDVMCARVMELGLTPGRRCARTVRLHDNPVTWWRGNSYSVVESLTFEPWRPGRHRNNNGGGGLLRTSEFVDAVHTSVVTFNPKERIYSIAKLRVDLAGSQVGRPEVETRSISLQHVSAHLHFHQILFLVWLSSHSLLCVINLIERSVSSGSGVGRKWSAVDLAVWVVGAAQLTSSVWLNCLKHALLTEVELFAHDLRGDYTPRFDWLITCDVINRLLLATWLVAVLAKAMLVLTNLHGIFRPFHAFTSRSLRIVAVVTAALVAFAYVMNASLHTVQGEDRSSSVLADVAAMSWPGLLPRAHKINAASTPRNFGAIFVKLAYYVVIFLVSKVMLKSILTTRWRRKRVVKTPSSSSSSSPNPVEKVTEIAAERFRLSGRIAKLKEQRSRARARRATGSPSSKIDVVDTVRILVRLSRGGAITCMSRLPIDLCCFRCFPYINKLVTRAQHLDRSDRSESMLMTSLDEKRHHHRRGADARRRRRRNGGKMKGGGGGSFNYFDKVEREFYGVVDEFHDDEEEDDEDLLEDCQQNVLTTEAILAEVESQVDEFYLRVSAWLDNFFLESSVSQPLYQRATPVEEILSYQNETTKPLKVEAPPNKKKNTDVPKSEKIRFNRKQQRHQRASDNDVIRSSASCHVIMTSEGKHDRSESTDLPGYIPDEEILQSADQAIRNQKNKSGSSF